MPTPTFDFSVFDGQELVAYLPSGAPSVADVAAVRRPLSRSTQRNIERYVELQATDVIFYLEAAALAGIALAASDSLTDADGATYSVLFVERQTLERTIAVVCRPV